MRLAGIIDIILTVIVRIVLLDRAYRIEGGHLVKEYRD